MIKREQQAECVFCKIVHGEIPAKFVAEGETFIAINDIHPKAPTHVLFICKEHIRDLNDLHAEDTDFFTEVFGEIGRLAKELGVSESGYRVVINTGKDSGQEVAHLHVHLLAGKLLGHMG